MPNNPRPTLAEIYETLNQLVEAYGQVMATFQSVVSDVADLRNEVQEIQQFNRGLLADAVTGRDTWQRVAEAHKAEAESLRAQLAALAKGGGCD